MRRRAGASAAMLAVFGLLVIPGGASAQGAGQAVDPGVDQQRLPSFVGSGLHRELLSRAMSGLPAEIFRRCPSLVANGSRVTVLRPVSFGADGVPDGGSWKEAFPVRGCGNDTVLNLFFTGTRDEKIDIAVGLSGGTRAGLVLQGDAARIAQTGAAAALPGCRRFVITDTRQADPGAGVPPSWTEVWTMAGCGRVLDVPMQFRPDATGTQMTQPGGVVVR